MAELEGVSPETAAHVTVPTETPARFARDLPKENTVRVRNLIKKYEMGTTVVEALRGTNFEIRPWRVHLDYGAVRFLGKSTLFNMIGWLGQANRRQSLH